MSTGRGLLQIFIIRLWCFMGGGRCSWALAFFVGWMPDGIMCGGVPALSRLYCLRWGPRLFIVSNIRLLSIGTVCPSSSCLPGIWPACGVYQIHSPICEAGHACVYHINNPSYCKCRHFFRDMQEILQGFGLHILISTSTNASMLMSLVSSGQCGVDMSNSHLCGSWVECHACRFFVDGWY